MSLWTHKSFHLPVVDPKAKHRNRNTFRRVIQLLFVICVGLFLWFQPCVRESQCNTLKRHKQIRALAPPLGLPDKVQRRWGQYSPWFPAEKYKGPPKGCTVDQVNILQRHGARYPNAEDTYDRSIKRLLSADKFVDSKLDFLRHFNYELGEEDLISFGAAQSFESGESSYRRYAHLTTNKSIPFVRASAKGRVVASATNWTIGFAAASRQRFNPTLNVVLPETQNTTLNNDCPNAGEGTKEKETWLSVFTPPIVERLESAAPGAKIDSNDVFNLMAMCPFETMAKEKPSKFCELFDRKEFDQFEYHGDVEKFYKTGYGEPLGPVQGVGYVNELIARLTGRPVADNTTHNSSFPFPLDRTIYADFTHENLMVGVYSAMGLFNKSSKPLSTTKMDKERDWVASKMVPFSARMVVERLACGKDYGQYVRVIVNDAAQQLEFCGADKDGVCRLGTFVESQRYARRSGNGDFAKCYN